MDNRIKLSVILSFKRVSSLSASENIISILLYYVIFGFLLKLSLRCRC